MSDKSKPTGPTGKIEFIENHRPALPSGDYEITVSQFIEATREILVPTTDQEPAVKEKKSLVNATTFTSQPRKFSVLGPRFTLEPQVIRAVFPPAGSLGEHSSVLPHISFNRSTLPWERFAKQLIAEETKALEKRVAERTAVEAQLAETPKLKTPWLALLLFDQDELVKKTVIEGDKEKVVEQALIAGKVSGPKACTLLRTGDFWALKPSPQVTGPEHLLSPEFPYESGQQDGDPVTVIDVARELLKAILPSFEDVQLMGHVRQPTDDLGTQVGDQVATLLANRLPQPGHMSVIHLVSLEGLYGQEKHDIWKIPDSAQFVRLVSLKSWRFTCLDEKHSFKGLLSNLHRSPSTLQLPSDRLNSAAHFLKRGCVPMPHEMRQGNRSVSWYRGPLAPGEVGMADKSLVLAIVDNKNDGKQNPSGGSLRARSADQLARYNPATGMFDVSYAAAWELGRLLTLQNEKVAVSLLDWKRRHRHDQERQRAMQELEHLPVVGRAVATDLPADVTRWFEDLALLKGVPFNYLAPDERMLPQESIRFFWVDPEWIRRLHDGAFSIGRVLPSDHKRDAAHHQNLLASPHGIVTGFLLRSEVVSGWPDLLVEGYDEAVPHEDYEHETQPPKAPLQEKIAFDQRLQEAMNNGDASLLGSRFGFVEVSDITVSPIKADSRWLVNVRENKKLYLVEKTKDGFQLSIENKLPMLRMERLSPNVLLCIFGGEIQTVDIHQKPEALHFGVGRSGEEKCMRFYKELKSHVGGELTECEVDIPWKGEKEKLVVCIQSLNANIQKKLKTFGGSASISQGLYTVAKNAVGEHGIETFFKAFKKAAESATSAQFALQMTEGVQKVRFVKG